MVVLGLGATTPLHNNDVAEPLFLTPYIETNRLDEARAASKVTNEALNQVAPSHTGFLTVNKEYNSNIFFWYVPAKNNAESAPVVLWLQGGPGGSSLFGLFVEHGPFQVDKDADLHERDIAWTEQFNMLYIDQPVGTGYSFTDKDQGYATNEDDVARDLYEALRQFYVIFPDLLQNEFYISGESYAGKYIPSLGYKIHTENQDEDNIKIPLTGMAIGDGLVDPINQWFYGDFLYQNGFVDENDKDKLNEMSAESVKLLKEGGVANQLKATLLFNQMMALFQEKTGLNDPFNFNNDIQPVDFNYYQDFLDNDYKMMIYNGQVDVIVTHPGTEKWIRNMNWKNKDAYTEVDRQIWKVENKVAGYVREVGTLKRILVRKAGHILSYDQPQTACDMITRFIQNLPFSNFGDKIAAAHCLKK